MVVLHALVNVLSFCPIIVRTRWVTEPIRPVVVHRCIFKYRFGSLLIEARMVEAGVASVVDFKKLCSLEVNVKLFEAVDIRALRLSKAHQRSPSKVVGG